jgi:hypothetical protein
MTLSVAWASCFGKTGSVLKQIFSEDRKIRDTPEFRTKGSGANKNGGRTGDADVR